MSAHILISTLLPTVLSLAAPTGFRLEYRYNLATVAGDVHTSAATVSWDGHAGELYVVGYGQVRVFNGSGMEVFRFGDDTALGAIYGVAALEDGELLVLSYRDGKPGLLRCNFRGEILHEVKFQGVPEAFRAFGPNRIAYRSGRVYLADEAAMRVLLVDPNGQYLASYDLAAIIDEADHRQDYGINGFGVDRDGSILFTVAPIFKAYVVTLAGKVRAFGRPGSAPGNFGIVAGIGSDSAGRYYVVDTLKSAVMVFDHNLSFVGQYGGRGLKPGQLISPAALAVADGRIFVSQQANRGVAVYQVRDQ
jgi:hypothetical protein